MTWTHQFVQHDMQNDTDVCASQQRLLSVSRARSHDIIERNLPVVRLCNRFGHSEILAGRTWAGCYCADHRSPSTEYHGLGQDCAYTIQSVFINVKGMGHQMVLDAGKIVRDSSLFPGVLCLIFMCSRWNTIPQERY